MSVWGDIRKKSLGLEERAENIRKATMTVRITSTEAFGYYNHIRLTPAQRRSFRWHGYHLELRDDRFKQYVHWRGGIITRLGDTGKETIQGFLDEVLKEYKYFDGFNCEEITGDQWWKTCDTEKNKKMVSLIRKKVAEHNDQMMQEEE